MDKIVFKIYFSNFLTKPNLKFQLINKSWHCKIANDWVWINKYFVHLFIFLSFTWSVLYCMSYNIYISKHFVFTATVLFAFTKQAAVLPYFFLFIYIFHFLNRFIKIYQQYWFWVYNIPISKKKCFTEVQAFELVY